MSHYTNGDVNIKDPKCLIAALEEEVPAWAGHIEYHVTPQNLYGYHGDKKAQVANVIIRRAQVGSASNDIGFLFQNGKCEAIVSDYDRHRYGQAWLNRITAESGVQAVLARAKARGERVSVDRTDRNKVKLIVSAR